MDIRCQQVVATVLVLVSLQVFVDLVNQQRHSFKSSPTEVHYRSKKKKGKLKHKGQESRLFY